MSRDFNAGEERMNMTSALAKQEPRILRGSTLADREILIMAIPLRVKDLTGKRFGRLTVRGYAGSDAWGHALWQCKCRCGRRKTARGERLNDRRIRSCGCLARELSSLRCATRRGIRSPAYRHGYCSFGVDKNRRAFYWAVMGAARWRGNKPNFQNWE